MAAAASSAAPPPSSRSVAAAPPPPSSARSGALVGYVPRAPPPPSPAVAPSSARPPYPVRSVDVRYPWALDRVGRVVLIYDLREAAAPRIVVNAQFKEDVAAVGFRDESTIVFALASGRLGFMKHDGQTWRRTVFAPCVRGVAVSMSPGASHVVSCSHDRFFISQIDVDGDKLRVTIKHEVITISPYAARVAKINDDNLRVACVEDAGERGINVVVARLHLESRELFRPQRLRLGNTRLEHLKLSSDGKLLLLGVSGSEGPSVRLYDVFNREEWTKGPFQIYEGAIFANASDEYVAVTYPTKVEVYRAEGVGRFVGRITSNARVDGESAFDYAKFDGKYMSVHRTKNGPITILDLERVLSARDFSAVMIKR